MSDTYKILLLPGDGIGPEVIGATKIVMDWFQDKGLLSFDLVHDHIGGAAYDTYGTPLAEHTLEEARLADAILMGAVGGPKWDGIDYHLRPEAGLLKLRKELDLFANLRPAIVFDALVSASSLKPEIVKGLDIMIVRELSGGVYFGEPRGIEDLKNGERRGFNTQSYTTSEIRRIGDVAFDLAQKRNGRVTSCDKANVMESGVLWREEISKLHQEHWPNIQLDHMYADNCAMQLLRNPAQFDVIVTDNLFGDILSDEAAMLTGSLGMLPSASLGAIKDGHITAALYEPVHGSAPDIAGQNTANPLATILSFAMMLHYSFNRSALAKMIYDAVNILLEDGYRTADIVAATSHKRVSTQDMAYALIAQLEKQYIKTT